MVGDNIIDYVKGESNPGLTIGYGSRPTISTNLSGKDVSLQVYNPSAQNSNSVKDVIKLTTEFQTYLPQAIQASSGLRIGNAVLYWDNNSKALALQSYNDQGQLIAGSFYATGGVSALGLSSGSGSGSVPAMTFGNLTVTDSIDVANKIVFDSDYEDDVYIKSTSSQLHLSSLDYIYLDTPVYNISIGNGSTISGIRVGTGNKLVFTIDGNEYNVSYTQ